MSLAQLQNLGLSGVGWTGVDIGGFYGDASGELLAPVLMWDWNEQGMLWYRFDAKRRHPFELCITCSALDAIQTSFSTFTLVAPLERKGRK